MNILWLGGIVLPRIAEAENLPIVHMNGWLINISEKLERLSGHKLIYVFDSNKEIYGKTEFYSYYGIKCKKASIQRFGEAYVVQAIKILKKVRPDVVHIWGTESSHSLAMVEACERIGIQDRCVISIQGLVSVYARHYYAYMPEKYTHGCSMKDFLKGNIAHGKKRFEIRGKLEVEALEKVHHVIGRTDWDRACVWNVNPNAKYHMNNETLREEFYSGKWDYNKCEKFSVFCSQGHYPIKGIHLVLEAVARVKKEFPQIKLYIGGKNYLKIPKWKQGNYDKYLISLIYKYGLSDCVIFTGFLSAADMKERYLKANIFVSASSIENSPNSVGEAMLLGTPVISSRVGGVHNLLTHGTEGYLYPADEPYMLAYYIKEAFSKPDQIVKMSENAIRKASVIHDVNKNFRDLIDIYNLINKDAKSLKVQYIVRS
mgnify:CR=1 FL=1